MTWAPLVIPIHPWPSTWIMTLILRALAATVMMIIDAMMDSVVPQLDIVDPNMMERDMSTTTHRDITATLRPLIRHIVRIHELEIGGLMIRHAPVTQVERTRLLCSWDSW